ncbi:MAG TPA: hypothetical protein VGJ95_09660 [Pseudonocardiaceae bacterium]
MSQHRMRSVEFQVHYLGSSADLAAVRRSLEARGVVSRSRLTPAVAVVVADLNVPRDHPTLVAARELGIQVLTPGTAINALLAARDQRQHVVTPPVANTPLITITMLALAGLIALLGLVGMLDHTSQPSLTTTVQQVSGGP